MFIHTADVKKIGLLDTEFAENFSGRHVPFKKNRVHAFVSNSKFIGRNPRINLNKIRSYVLRRDNNLKRALYSPINDNFINPFLEPEIKLRQSRTTLGAKRMHNNIRNCGHKFP